MVQFMIFINLFFVPALTLYMIYHRKGRSLQLKLETICQYCIIAVCNIPLTKIPTFLSKKVGGIFIPIDSGYYTIAALASALLIYLVYVYQDSERIRRYWTNQYTYYKTYLKRKYWSEKVSQRGVKQILRELIPSYILIFVSCFMMLIFEPILMYATNMNDFWFDFKIMIWPVLGVFACFLLIGIFITSIIYFANLFFSGKLIFYKLFTLMGFIVFLLLYVQGNWLSGNLPPLTGEPIIWENYGKSENSILILSAIFLSVVALISVWKYKLACTIRYAATSTGLICIVLFVSLIPTVIENKALKSKDTFVPTLENYNAVSSNQNFLIFLVDTMDSKMCHDVINSDEDFREIFDDFTYYSDAMSVYPHTRDSIPNILTGSVNYNETNFIDYCSSAYNQSPLFEELAKNEYGINLYSNDIRWGGDRKYNIENSSSIYDIKVDIYDFLDQELKYISFKYFPYRYKQYSQIETLDFGTCKIVSSEQNDAYSWGNRENYGRITENSILDKRDKNYFQFVHCEGVHTPFNMDKYLNSVEKGTQEQKIAASLAVIKAYLQRLKDNDAYDNSIIVIMSDHGNIYTMEDYEQPYLFLARCNPILYIKGINEHHELIESDRPVSYSDLQDAFCDLIDGKQSTELFSELQPGRTRTVLWHIWTEEYHMVEYETAGNAREPLKFTPTGNVYDLEE